MKIRLWPGFVIILGVITLGMLSAAPQLVSPVDSTIAPPAGGGGDSGLSIISVDGRFALFASTADNLVPSHGASMSSRRMNVFLRDCTNHMTILVSLNLSGTGGGNGDSFPTGISANGRYALFESSASDLVANDTNNASDVFVRDVMAGTNILVSAAIVGGSGNGVSRNSVMTPDGHYIAFVSAATNLVVGDTNKIPDVFVRDLQLQMTMLASAGAVSNSASTSTISSESPVITPDGRYVAFYSTASNLVTNVKTPGEVFVRDLIAGKTIWASTNARPILQSVIGSTNGVSYNQRISDDGQFVVFETSTNTLIVTSSPGVILRYSLQTGMTDIIHTNATATWSAFNDSSGLDMTPDGRFILFVANGSGGSELNTVVYEWDAQTGTNVLVSTDPSNTFPASGICDSPAVDASGQHIAFLSSSTNLTSNPLAGAFHLYWRDTQANSTRLVDADTNGMGVGVGPSTVPSLSSDGRFVSFESADGSLVANDNNHDYDTFVRDTLADTTELISAHHPGLPSQTPNGPSLITAACVSSNGLYVTFASDADNLAPNDTNGFRDVFVRDVMAGTNIFVSVGTNGFPGAGMSSEPSISADGRFVAFTSWANNLAANDTNNAQDVFVRDLQTGTTALVSVNTGGIFSVNGNSGALAVSADGRYVLLRSKAQNLTSASYTAGTENLFLRDRQAGTTVALTTGGWTSFSMTSDGRFISFIGIIPSVASKLYVWDSQTASRVYTNSASSLAAATISPNGQFLAYLSGSPASLSAADRLANSNWVVSAGAFSLHPGLRFSGDGHFLTYATSAANVVADTNGIQDVYVYDLLSRSNFLVGRSFSSLGALNGISDSPDISANGRFIAYRSFASNNVPGDTNNSPDLFVYDRLSGATTLVTVNQSGSSTANNWSLTPWFSSSGQTLVFQGGASDLISHDFNRAIDIFALDLSPADAVDPTNAAAELNAQIVFGGVPGLTPGTPPSNPVIVWPVSPGISYGLQFKNDLSDPNWQNFIGNEILVGTNGYAIDLAPVTGQRFYRFILNN